MRIADGENPLDGTSVHPESYEAAEKLLKKQGYKYEQLIRNEWLEPILKKYKFSSYEDLLNVIGFGEISAQKIINILKEEYIKSVSGSKEAELLAKIDSSKNKKEKVVHFSYKEKIQ